MERINWKIKVRPNGGSWIDLMSPILIGSSASADIVVHSSAVAPHAKILTVNEGKLWCWDIQREAYVDDHGLRAYGIEVRGPFPADKAQRQTLLRRVTQMEQAWLDRVPQQWKGCVGAHLGRAQRWTWYAIFLAGCLMVLIAAIQPSNGVVVDRSRSPLMMAYAQISNATYGQSENLLDFRHGLTFRFKIPVQSRGRDHAFEFLLGGMDKGGEIEVVVNGKKLYSNPVRPECVDDFCRVAILIPRVFTEAPKLDLILVHRYPESSYLVTNILFDQLRPLSEQERLAAERRLNLARRLFDERAVSYQNLIGAKKQIRQVLEMIRLRSGAENLQHAAASLDADLENEIAAQTEDMWFQSRRYIRLGEYRSAVNQLRGLREFYPDPGHPRYVQINLALKQLEEIL